jgi:MFS family permease
MPSIGVIFRMFGLGSTVFLMVLYLSNVFHKSPSSVGIFMMVHSIPTFLFVPVGGIIADRWNSRNAAALGLLIHSSGMLWLSFIDPANNELLLMPGLFFAGLGAGVSLTPFTKDAVASLGEENVGLAAGLFNMIRFAGVAASAPLMGLILAAGFKRAGGFDTIPEPYQFGYLILAGCLLIGTLIALRIPTPSREFYEEPLKK